MLVDDNLTINLSSGAVTNYTLPTGFDHVTEAVYTSADHATYNPLFTDYTIANGVLTVPDNGYDGTLDLYFQANETIQTSNTIVNAEQLYLRCAKYAGEMDNVLKNADGTYTPDTISLFETFRGGLNRAKNLFTTIKFAPTFTDTITLDAMKQFYETSLSLTLKRIIKVVDTDGNNVYFTEAPTGTFYCPSKGEGAALSVMYEYLPDDLPALTETNALSASFDFPTDILDPYITCYYSTMEYYSLPENYDSDMAGLYNSYWTEAVGITNTYRGERKKVCIK